MTKLLLYCTKNPKKLLIKKDYGFIFDKWLIGEEQALNGKIVAECDFEVEEIKWNDIENYNYEEMLPLDNLLKNSCLTKLELEDYLNGKDGYAIHIKNLNIFDEPRELRNYHRAKSIDGHSPCWHCKRFGTGCERCDIKAPQNMMYAYLGNDKYILISIRPEWLCKILNGEKTIEIRKKVLKEML